MTNERMNKVLAELKEYGQMKKELDNQIKALQDECKLYMTEHELSELFNDDNSIVARYSEVISTKFDTTAFKNLSGLNCIRNYIYRQGNWIYSISACIRIDILSEVREEFTNEQRIYESNLRCTVHRSYI